MERLGLKLRFKRQLKKVSGGGGTKRATAGRKLVAQQNVESWEWNKLGLKQMNLILLEVICWCWNNNSRIYFGGADTITSGHTAVSESWNGSNWTEVGKI